jgi:hypothetical protein
LVKGSRQYKENRLPHRDSLPCAAVRRFTVHYASITPPHFLSAINAINAIND